MTMWQRPAPPPNDRPRLQRSQTSKIARFTHPLIARPAGQVRRLRPTRRRPGADATAPTAPTGSVRRSRRSASPSSPRCAAARCRRRRTAGFVRPAPAAPAGRTRRSRRPDRPYRRAVARRGGDPDGRLPIRRPGAQRPAVAWSLRPPVLRPVAKKRLRPPSERVARAHVHDDQVVRPTTPASRSRSAIRASAPRVERHLDRVSLRIRVCRRPSPRSPASRSHWFTTECRRPQLAGAVHDARVHPAPPLDVVADPLGAPAGPRQPRAARTAVQVDGEVVARPPEPSRQRDIVERPAARRVRLRRDDHLVEVRIVRHNGAAAGSTT